MIWRQRVAVIVLLFYVQPKYSSKVVSDEESVTHIAHVVPIWDMFPEFMANDLKVDYLIICIICDTDSVNKLTLQMYALHKYK